MKQNKNKIFLENEKLSVEIEKVSTGFLIRLSLDGKKVRSIDFEHSKFVGSSIHDYVWMD